MTMILMTMIVVGSCSPSVSEFVVILFISVGVHLIPGATTIVVTLVESGVPIVRDKVGLVIHDYRSWLNDNRRGADLNANLYLRHCFLWRHERKSQNKTK